MIKNSSNSQKLTNLRKKHSTFTYDKFEIHEEIGQLRLRYRFVVEPDIIFSPSITIPLKDNVDTRNLNNLAFHLGMIEMISYWKATCSPNIVIKAGYLTQKQINWWRDLFMNGLGEFFYKNQIDFRKEDFLNIKSSLSADDLSPINSESLLSGDLIPIGGGKDSIITLESIKHHVTRKNVLLVNPTQAAQKVATLSGFDKPIIIDRQIDEKLLELNHQGYLNGHTPFSAYLAFLSILVAYLYNFQQIVVSNERSAGKGNISYKGLDVNHQYSKSFRFEKYFRDYVQRYLSRVNYFSFLRPIYELQVTWLFSKYKKYHKIFVSCNVNRGRSWCGKCPKCAFVFLCLFPFLPAEKLNDIFGGNYFEDPELAPYFLDLVGLGNYKPFECVGTKEESIIAFALSQKKYIEQSEIIPPLIDSIDKKLNLGQVYQTHKSWLKDEWSKDHFLPPIYEKVLKQTIRQVLT